MSWSIDLSTANTTVANQITYDSFDTIAGTPLKITIFGTGLVYSGGTLTGGTINSMQIVDPTTGGAGTTIQTVTMTGGMAAASFGTYMADVANYGAAAPDLGLPVRRAGADLHGRPRSRCSAPTARRSSSSARASARAAIPARLPASRTTTSAMPCCIQLSGLSISTYAGAGALSSDEATYAFLTQGNNTVTLNSANYSWLDLEGGLGSDIINGLVGSTNDWVTFESDATSSVVVNLTTNVVTGGAGSDTLSSIENVSGSFYADQITGNASGNQLRGNNGNDTLSGLAGDDFLNGEDGADSMSGGDNDDQLNGQSGNDTLNGGAGNNSLQGGGDSDVFVYTRDSSTNFVNDFGARVFEAYVSGDSVVPSPIGTNADGFFQIVLNRTQTSAQIYLNVNNLDINGSQTAGTTADNVTSIALRAGNATQTGAVLFGIVNPSSDLDGDTQINPYFGSPGAFVQTTWDGAEGNGTTLAAQIASLAAGNVYLDVWTTGNPAGEIRGQIQEVGTTFADKIDLTALNIGTFQTL